MKKILLIILTLFMSVPFSYGSDTVSTKIGVHVIAPFVTKSFDGPKYGGLCISLLEKYMDKCGVSDITYVQYETTNELIEAVNRGEVRMGVGSITINGPRYEKVDFTQPFFTSTISIAYDKDKLSSSWSYLSSFMNVNTLLGVVYLFVFFYLIGLIFWVTERGKSGFFRSDHWGVWDGFYYAVIVFTTIGFGDKVCHTKVGKVLTVLYGLICLGIAGIFIGNISSSITLNKLESDVSIETLSKRKVGTVKESSVTSFLDDKGVKYIGYDNATEGLGAIKSGELEVFVYDTPIMQYIIDKKNLSDIVALSEEVYDPQYYGFAYQKGDTIGNSFNPLIISHIKSEEWENNLHQFNLDQ